MFDLMMIAYVVILLVLAILVARYFPLGRGSKTTDFGLGPIGGLTAFAFLITPAICAYLLPEYLRTWLSPFVQPDWTERFAQIAAPVLILYITIRGIIVWLGIALLAGLVWLAVQLVQYVGWG